MRDRYTNPLLALAPSAQTWIWDDFLRPGAVSSRYGDAFWELTSIGGSATVADTTPAAATEAGVLEITTAAAVGAAGILGYTSATPFYRAPPAGSLWCVKLRSADLSNYEMWSGFAQSAADVSTTANDFVGVRSTGGNLFGVVRNGTTESTVDLGVVAEVLYRIVGFERLSDDTFQFFTVDASDEQYWDRTNVGSPVAATNEPNTTLSPIALGYLSSDGTARTGRIDFWALGGRVAR